MRMEVLSDPDAVAHRAAVLIAEQAREAVAVRGHFVMAVSGGKSPWAMLRALADQKMPWESVHVMQVDERIAPSGDPDRNFTHLHASLLEHAALSPAQIHPMPVEIGDLESWAAHYGEILREFAGSPPVLDLVHLGLGPDGHTASLVPRDSVLKVTDRDVALTGLYKGRRRMTLTYPVIDRARIILWLVMGREKAAMLRRLRVADPTIPAGQVAQDLAIILADRAAAGSGSWA